MKIKPILEGIKNDLIKDDTIEATAHKRLSVCRKCPLYTAQSVVGERCDKNKSVWVDSKQDMIKGCGCKLSWKSRQDSSPCPLGKW